MTNQTKTDRNPVHRMWLTDSNGEILKIPSDCNHKGIKYITTEQRNAVVYCGKNNLKYFDVWGKDGIRTIYNMTAEKSMPYMLKMIKIYKDTFPESDFYKDDEGNAIRTISAMLMLSELFPFAIWRGE